MVISRRQSVTIPARNGAENGEPGPPEIAPERPQGTLLRATPYEPRTVPVIIASFDSHNSRNLKQLAGNAVAYGMDWDAALRAVTLTPATALGFGDRYGSLEPGKIADAVVWSGDSFEFSSAAANVFVRGLEMPLTSRQRQLMERYKSLPPKYQ